MDKKENPEIYKLKSIILKEFSTEDLFKCAFHENFWN